MTIFPTKLRANKQQGGGGSHQPIEKEDLGKCCFFPFKFNGVIFLIPYDSNSCVMLLMYL